MYLPLIIELKWNKSADGAISGILEKKYPEILGNLKGEVLLAGINYDKDEKKYSAKIEKYILS